MKRLFHEFEDDMLMVKNERMHDDDAIGDGWKMMDEVNDEKKMKTMMMMIMEMITQNWWKKEEVRWEGYVYVCTSI